MKKLAILFTASAALVALASCSNLNTTPEFTDDQAFVAFDKLNVSVAEDGKTVRLPLTIASVDPAKASVSYAVVDSDANKAKEGKNFKFSDGSGVVTFNGTDRTAYIDIDILDNPGVFTGDIKFQIELVSAGELDLGFNKTCTVTITDNDHPLANILGWYTCVDEVGAKTWQMEIRKDPKDVTVCWFYNIGAMSSSWAGDDIMYYGNVDMEKGTITIPLGQTSEYLYSGTTPVTLYSVDMDYQYIYKTGNYVMTIADGGKTIYFEKEWGIYLQIDGAGYIGVCRHGVVATKN